MAIYEVTETVERRARYSLVVWDEDAEELRGGEVDPTPADYIAALRAEPEEVRAEVRIGLGAPWPPIVGHVAAERDALIVRLRDAEGALVMGREAQELAAEKLNKARSDLATVTAERDALRARLDGAVAAIAADDEPADWGSKVGVTSKDGRDRVGFESQELHGFDRWALWSPLPRVLAEIARSQPGALLAAADKLRGAAAGGSGTSAIVGEWRDGAIHDGSGDSAQVVNEALVLKKSTGFAIYMHTRNVIAVLDRAGLLPKPVATTDRETRAVLALVEWTRRCSEWNVRKQKDAEVYEFRRDLRLGGDVSVGPALALCARLGIEVE